MAVLNAWQKIDRVLPGQPFGTGVDGAYSSATIPTLTKDSCSGTATSTTLTTTGSTFANGDILLIHQTRGTGVGQWEINKVASGGGSTSLTLSVALNYTYTDSGASQAQAIKILQYSDVTVQSGTWTVPAWNHDVGGICPIAIKGDLTVTGTTSARDGFSGGTSVSDSNGIQGEGSGGAGTYSTSANGNGGGGGAAGNNAGAGGGGGYAAAGTNGGSDAGTGGTGGSQVGDADMTAIFLGGGGGDSGDYPGVNQATVGGTGGADIIFFVKNIVSIGGAITVDGNNGANPNDADRGGGGGGAGGGVLIVCQTATLGTTKITAAAGSGGSRPGSTTGGAGSVGRIAIHHSGTVTGTTNPTFTDVTDASLVEVSGSFMIMF